MLLCIVHARKVCVFVCVDDEYDKSVDGVCMIDDIYVYEIHCMTYSVCVGGVSQNSNSKRSIDSSNLK